MIKENILKILNDDHYEPLNYNGLAQQIMYQHSEYDLNDVYKALVELENEHLVIRVKNDKLQSLTRLGLVYGNLEIKRKGFGFVRTKDFDVFIKKDNLNSAINKDKVLVKVINKDSKSNKEGFIYRVLEHGYNVIVGELIVKGNKSYVKPDDSSLNFLIRINKKNLIGAYEGHKVLCYITEVDKHNDIVYGAIKTIIGHINDVGIDILSVVYKYGFSPEFDPKAIKEAKAYSEDDIELEQRTDLRSQVTFTIDGADAKDLDDAICLEVNDKGNYVLSVSIADVSYYVKEKSALDNEAYARGTSVYLADRVVPMLPQQLSNGICSLLEGVDRLTQTCRMEFDKNGKVINYDIFESIINSNYRLTYDDVNLILLDKTTNLTKYQDIFSTLKQMHELSILIRANRDKRGMLDFDVPEPKIVVDKKGKVIDIQARERGEAQKLIEDFMIIANETVAQHVYWLSLPFVYRTHEDPNPEKIRDFLTYATLFNIKPKFKSDKITSKDVQTLLKDIAKNEDALFLDKLLLRSMSKAKYEKECIGHFGLASKYYTHFTSPIRRYPDLIVHRLLRKYLYNDVKPNTNELDKLDKQLIKTTEHASAKERDAIDAERQVNDMKMAEYMEQYINHEFTGHISSITSFGMFIELENTVEGLIHISNLTDDHYIYDAKFHRLRAERSKKEYRLGQKVEVIVESVNVKDRNIDFKLDNNNKA